SSKAPIRSQRLSNSRAGAQFDKRAPPRMWRATFRRAATHGAGPPRVMAGLVPAISVGSAPASPTGVAGTSPAMTHWGQRLLVMPGLVPATSVGEGAGRSKCDHRAPTLASMPDGSEDARLLGGDLGGREIRDRLLEEAVEVELGGEVQEDGAEPDRGTVHEHE